MKILKFLRHSVSISYKNVLYFGGQINFRVRINSFNWDMQVQHKIVPNPLWNHLGESSLFFSSFLVWSQAWSRSDVFFSILPLINWCSQIVVYKLMPCFIFPPRSWMAVTFFHFFSFQSIRIQHCLKMVCNNLFCFY